MKHLFLYGLITGLVIAAWMYLEYLMGFHASEIGRYSKFAVFLFTILGIYLGMRAYRNYTKAGQITYWQGVFSGVLISVFAGIVTAIFTYLYLSFINPEFIDYMVDLNRRTNIQMGATDVQVQAEEIVTRATYQALPQALRTLGGYIAAGSLFSLIIAGILKSRRLEITENQNATNSVNE